MAGAILVVEDEPAIQELVSFACSNGGYHVRRADSVRAAQEAIRQALPDLVILDWMLPDRPGVELLRELRGDERTRGLPIIMLTARSAESDKVAGLDAGADDYVVKPFSPRELVARVRARLRRRVQAAQARWQRTGAFELDREGLRIRYRGQLLDLTRYEYGVLEALLARPGAVLSRTQLMERVWADALDSTDRTVDTHVKTLRAKLRAAADGDGGGPIRTHRGIGYSLDADG